MKFSLKLQHLCRLKLIGLVAIFNQSRTQSPQALWPAVGRQERLWGTGILLPQDFCARFLQSLSWRLPADQKA